MCYVPTLYPKHIPYKRNIETDKIYRHPTLYSLVFKQYSVVLPDSTAKKDCSSNIQAKILKFYIAYNLYCILYDKESSFIVGSII